MRGTEALGDITRVQNVVAVGPGGFGVGVLGEGAGDEETGAGEGIFTIGIRGGVEVGIMGGDRGVLAQGVLSVNCVSIGDGEVGVVVLEESRDILRGGGVGGEVGAFVIVVAVVGS